MASNKRSSVATTGGSSTGSVDFILRTAMERQSGNKRPIRPKLVDDSLLADDSDDSDFNVDEHDSVSGTDISKDSNSSGASDEGSDDENSRDSSDSEIPQGKSSLLREAMQKLDNESSGFYPPAGLGSKKKKTKKKPKPKKVVAGKKAGKTNGTISKAKKTTKKLPATATKDERKRSNPYSGSVMDRVFKATCAMRDIRSDIDLNRKICSFCLGEKNDGSNEIVECDSCKITVHEGCYGLSDNLSVSSDSGSSSATEPWFCDFCKNPDNRCSCALCPNPGGLLKATAEEQFVHLVCAHYTRGIISRMDNKVYLDTIVFSKWGNKPCTLCSSSRFASTGITVECDAGLCKQYVHVSCAQRFGLLSDPCSGGINDEDDQLFASCKLHGQKDQAKHRATLFKVLQEQIRIKREKSSFCLTPAIRVSQGRIQERLRKVQAKLAAKRMIHSVGSSLVSNLVNGNKLPFRRLCALPQKRKSRNLRSCAYSVSKFLQKIENMGGDITSLELEEKNERIVANIKKRWNVLPSLTVEFTAYYFDREARIEALSKQCRELVEENENLNDRQIALNTVLENEAVDHMEIMDDTLTMNSELADLRNILKTFSPGNKTFTTSTVLKGLPQRPKSPVRKSPMSQNINSTGNTESKKTGVSLPSANPGRLTLHICAICKKSDQQHLITKCDDCALNFHLGCLDPPLTRMPRRSKLVGWICSDCCEEKSEKEEEVIDTDAPRALRGRTQLKRPEKYRGNEDSDDDVVILKEKSGIKAPQSQKSPALESVVVPITSKPVPDLLRLKVQPMECPHKMEPENIQVFNSSPGVLLRYSNVNILKKMNSSASPAPRGLIRPARFTPPQPAKKMKMSTTTSPCSLVKGSVKSNAKDIVPPPASPPNRFVRILPRPERKEETSNQMKTSPKLSKGKTTPKGTKSSLSSLPGTNWKTPDTGPNHAVNGINPHQQASPQSSSKKLKVVLSPVNSEHGTKVRINDSISPRLRVSNETKTGSSTPQMKKGTLSIPKTLSCTSIPPAGGDSKPQRKSSARTKKIENKANHYITNPNPNTFVQGDGAHCNSVTSGIESSNGSGKCSVCAKAEDKKNLVMCDDCNLEFHFNCVPPYMPYNPKRRGYAWVCERCGDKSDDEGNIGAVRENVNGVQKN